MKSEMKEKKKRRSSSSGEVFSVDQRTNQRYCLMFKSDWVGKRQMRHRIIRKHVTYSALARDNQSEEP